MKTNAEQHWNWLKNAYSFDNDPVIIAAKTNAANPHLNAPLISETINRDSFNHHNATKYTSIENHTRARNSGSPPEIDDFDDFDISEGFFEAEPVASFLPPVPSALRENTVGEELNFDDYNFDSTIDDIVGGMPESDSDPFEPSSRAASSSALFPKRDECMDNRDMEKSSTRINSRVEQIVEEASSQETVDLSEDDPEPVPYVAPITQDEYDSRMKDMMAQKTKVSMDICDLMEQLDNATNDAESAEISSRLRALRAER